MTAPDYAAFPERPPSEVEWEELLVRYEVTPRALRLAVDDAGPEHEEAVREVLARALADEAATADWLERARTGSPDGLADAEMSVDSVDEAVGRFTGLRARNFAAVQRGGLGGGGGAAALGGGRRSE